MKSQKKAIFLNRSNRNKDIVDSFGGPIRMSKTLNCNLSTIYKWMCGHVINMSYAIRIVLKKPELDLASLGYDLGCDPMYLKIINYFGSQRSAAKALGISQVSVRCWLVGSSNISFKTAVKLEEVTDGEFHPSDFEHLTEIEA